MTQCEKVLRHLEDCGSLTSLEAVNEYGIMRRASRINDLKHMGVDIISEMVTGKNRYEETVRYSVYRLAKGVQNEDIDSL